MIKLIISDLDGTLLPFGEVALSSQISETINKIISSGTHFCISSGRDLCQLTALLPGITDKIYLISFDGALCTKEGRVLYEMPIPGEAVAYAARTSSEGAVLLHGIDRIYALGDPPASLKSQVPTVPINSVKELPQGVRIYKITKFEKPLPGSPTSPLRLHWDGKATGCFEYLCRFANKGAAAKDLQNRLMLTPYDTAALGDGENDVALFKAAAVRICVGDRSEKLQSLATHTVPEGKRGLLLLK